MWLGEQINDKGVGNGISLIIFSGIVARIPKRYQKPFHQPQRRRHICDHSGDIGCTGSAGNRRVVLIQEGQRRNSGAVR